MSTPVEKFLTRKELAAALGEIGLTVHEDWAGELIRHCPQSAVKCLRLSDAVAFLQRNPDFEPRSETWHERARRGAATRGIRVLG